MINTSGNFQYFYIDGAAVTRVKIWKYGTVEQTRDENIRKNFVLRMTFVLNPQTLFDENIFIHNTHLMLTGNILRIKHTNKQIFSFKKLQSNKIPTQPHIHYIYDPFAWRLAPWERITIIMHRAAFIFKRVFLFK